MWSWFRNSTFNIVTVTVASYHPHEAYSLKKIASDYIGRNNQLWSKCTVSSYLAE